MNLPESPGVYIMKNSSEEIIYIGKAKVLKNRVSQYFGSQNNHAEKVRKMVSQVANFEYIVTDSEFEALVLECSLIKQNKPKYNILLKDDKGYHYIKVTNEEWPRISIVGKIIDDGSMYIGPYMSLWAVKKAVDEVTKIFLLPTCSRKFSNVRIKGRPCLNYYIKQCCAPCVGMVKRNTYVDYVNDAVDFLKGADTFSISRLTAQMNQASDNLNFELAARLRDRILAIKKLHEKQKVVEVKPKDQDVIAFEKNEVQACFEVFRIRDGVFKDREEFFLDVMFSDERSRSEFMEQLYSIRSDIPPQIITDGNIEDCDVLESWLSKISGKKVKIVVPKRGDKAKLVLMCKNNAKESLLQKFKFTEKKEDILVDLQECLGLSKKPVYIEAYDISNLAGSDNVAGMIVYENAKPNRAMYRRFKIKEVIGQDDYGSMREVINRRLSEYEKLINEGKIDGFARLPDLILLDGGKTHVKVVREVLNARGYSDLPVFGMVKDSKHRTRAISESSDEISIKNNRRLFTFITKIQDEVHRFAISYHKKSRKANATKSKLTQIPGVGKARATALFKHFKTLKRISEASVHELSLLPEISNLVAESIYDFFHN